MREELRQGPIVRSTSPTGGTRDSPLFVPEDKEAPDASLDHEPVVTETRPLNPRRESETSTKSAPLNPEDMAVQRQTSSDTSRDPPPTRDSQSIPTITARNGRVWKKGDVVVDLHYGEHLVGDVKILHLPNWLVHKLVKLKEPAEFTLKIRFLERNVIECDSFPVLARNVRRFFHLSYQMLTNIQLDNYNVALGSIESYEDTIAATTSLAEHLESNNVAAIWELPRPTETLVMILYPCRAPGWQHLGQQRVTMFEPRLQLAFRNKRPGFHLDPLHAAPRSMSRQTAGPDSRPPRPVAPAPRHDLSGSTTPLATAHVESPLEEPMMFERRSSVQRPVSPRRRSSGSLPTLQHSLATKFSALPGESFFADFEPMLFGADKAKTKPRVFVSFAKSYPREADAVKAWLRQHVNDRNIYTDAETDGWSDWMEIISHTKSGIVLFLDQSPLYCDLKFLASCLSRFHITCFKLTFPRWESAVDDDRGVVSRLFPRGTVLFITEHSMMNSPEEVLRAMRWFEQQSRRKAHSWKLSLLPDAIKWILQHAIRASGEAQQRYAWCYLRSSKMCVNFHSVTSACSK